MFEPNSLRLVSVRGVDVEAPLGGTMLIIANDDQPGVIGEVGTILGRHGVNIANFALGRGETRAPSASSTSTRTAALRALDEAVDEQSAACPPSSPRGSSVWLDAGALGAAPPADGSGRDHQRAGMDPHPERRSATHRLAVHVKVDRLIALDRHLRRILTAR